MSHKILNFFPQLLMPFEGAPRKKMMFENMKVVWLRWIHFPKVHRGEVRLCSEIFGEEKTTKGEPESAAKDMFDKTPISKRDDFFASRKTRVDISSNFSPFLPFLFCETRRHPRVHDAAVAKVANLRR